MWKKVILTTIVVFIAFVLMDFLLHSLILGDIYADSKELWRPMEEMKWAVQYMAVFFSSLAFVFIYAKLVSPKKFKNAIIYGAVWGFAAGMSMGYASYSVMPIPYILAAGWFWGVLIEATVGGVIIGLMIKE